ncbi:hypothetical protein FCJ61_05970 [Burkholderia metallica]|uniref:hypothetical protein n=1 Tax=Burkholderia metallica TaxID=488729 RepID=UPI00157B59CC|nr:hypothetical protein [Burkholderia metallica]NTZ82559.1 hypothetical protein [Burkholderia metallica]
METDVQTGPPSPDKGPGLIRHEAAELLLLFARTLASPQTPLWGRARCIDVIDALLGLATRHGFTLSELLREMLDTDLHGDNTRLLVQAAFKGVPDPELLAVFQESGFHVWLRGMHH